MRLFFSGTNIESKVCRVTCNETAANKCVLYIVKYCESPFATQTHFTAFYLNPTMLKRDGHLRLDETQRVLTLSRCFADEPFMVNTAFFSM